MDELFKNIKIEKKPSKIRSQRDEYISKFLDRLNPEREKSGYPPLTAKQFIGRVHKAFDNSDAGILYLLWKKCEDFDNFSKGFFYLTRKQ